MNESSRCADPNAHHDAARARLASGATQSASEPASAGYAPFGPTASGTCLSKEAITCTAIDSGRPDLFEQRVCDAFAFFGFQAEWLGGSGKTDVPLDARLGAADSYRVVVDCKTSASGSVSDQQINWMTLSEHMTKHDAQHAAVVAPNPSGSRLFDRARERHVAVISADQLAGLCRQHAKTQWDSTTIGPYSRPAAASTPRRSMNEPMTWRDW